MSTVHRTNGRRGAHISWARTDDPSARTAKARAAAIARFEKIVDPEGVLDPEDRARRAEHARKAFLAEAGRKGGSSARRRRKAAS